MNDSSSGVAAIGLIGFVVWLAIIILVITAMWKVFMKAGQPGWGSLIPIYNVYLLCKIAGKPGWWFLLMFIPIVNIVIAIMLALGVSANFGKGGGFAVGLLLLPMIFYPILAFGEAEYGSATA
jgi:hypothetical protein